MTLDDIYTPPEEAKEELMRRWEDKELRKKAEEFIGHPDCLPDYFFEKPHAISGDQIASPNLCTMSFMETTKKLGLDPMNFEYLEDIFVTKNIDKLYLAKMCFYHAQNDGGNMITSTQNIIDMSGKEQGKKFTDIKTSWGEGFVDFHHRIFFDHFPEAKVFDGSKWFEKSGGKARLYYEKFLAIGICHGILFEDFLNDDYEKVFFNNIVKPAFENVQLVFGLKPLISKNIPVTYLPKNIEERHWWFYPEYVKIKI